MSDFKNSVADAAAALCDLFEPTPCQRNEHLSNLYGANIWLKREDLTPVRSYKIRGAFNAMRKVIAKGEGGEAFVCASAGNHAQGVAFACRHFGVKGVIFMPVTTPQQKILKTRMFGGDGVSIELIGDYFDQTLKAAQDYCEEKGAHFLSPFDDADVIEGQATVASEVATQMPDLPDLVVLPVGGGGLSSGVIRYFGDQVAYRLVEPEGGASLAAALTAGKPVALPQVDSFVDGAAVAQIGAIPFETLRHINAGDVYQCPEDRVCGTMLDMLNVEGVVLEPAGALSLDVLQDLADEIAGKTVLCVTSGGNFDFERLPEVKERARRYQGLKKYFILRLPQRPGALRDFLDLLGPSDNITRFEYLKKSARTYGSVLIGIETKDAKNFDILFDNLDAHGMRYSDITNDETIAEFIV